jgi:hypothetical protein
MFSVAVKGGRFMERLHSFGVVSGHTKPALNIGASTQVQNLGPSTRFYGALIRDST